VEAGFTTTLEGVERPVPQSPFPAPLEAPRLVIVGDDVVVLGNPCFELSDAGADLS
jgi:hypothetical protein